MRDQKPRLTLVLPCFSAGASQTTAPRLPALETLLARATVSGRRSLSAAELLFSLFGRVAEELPVGAVRRVGDGGAADDGWWCCADPASFLADRDRLHLVGPRELNVRPEEADALVQLFNAHFAKEGWLLESLHPERWYLRAPGPQSVRMTPLAGAQQQELRDAMPRGQEALPWRRFINETQMLFHGSDVNHRREERGQLPINGIWPWGGGAVPSLARPFAQVWCADPLTRGLALLSGGELRPLSAGLNATTAGDMLVALMGELDSAGWREAENTWFLPVRDAVAQDRLAAVDIECTQRFTLRRRDLRRWWRRRRPLGEWQ